MTKAEIVAQIAEKTGIEKGAVQNVVENDIWKNLYDFPNIESPREWTVDEVIASPEFAHIVSATPFTIVNVSAPITHKLTHRTIIAQFIEIKLSQELPSIQTINLFLTPERDLDRYPVPRLIDSYLNH